MTQIVILAHGDGRNVPIGAIRHAREILRLTQKWNGCGICRILATIAPNELSNSPEVYPRV
eukprot:CAMPEP_0171311546 /NCGR_PEP_ID=MMETSP0816-20121228/21817_1 /TAXON_ID=420281 /ORGANISM="Proboscia inermis, Strain CCAP1064/1" /LENGTH=60 /DNA_ID=CAMNT_0011796391 /DNA_START=249 /DNA_END=431 /DNA_ORIENTATION=+